MMLPRFIFTIVCPWILLTMRDVSDKNCRENKSTHFVLNNFFPKNHATCEMMKKNIVESDMPPMTIQYIACALHFNLRYTHTHTHKTMYNTSGFSTTTMVAQTHLSIRLYVHCLFHVSVGLQNCNKQLFASSCPPVHVHETAGLSLNRVFMKLDIVVFFGNLSRKFKFH